MASMGVDTIVEIGPGQGPQRLREENRAPRCPSRGGNRTDVEQLAPDAFEELVKEHEQ